MAFKFKWFVSDSVLVDLKRLKDKIVFSVSKSLVKHNPIDLKSNWVLKRLDKNIFILFRHKDESKVKKLLKEGK